MQIRLPVILVLLATLLSASTRATQSSDDQPDAQTNIVCRCEMHALVSYLKETAALEGDWLRVEWHPDGSASVCDSDFCQHIWCDGDEMHIEFTDSPPTHTEQ